MLLALTIVRINLRPECRSFVNQFLIIILSVVFVGMFLQSHPLFSNVYFLHFLWLNTLA